MQGDFDTKLRLLNEWESSVKEEITKKFSVLREGEKEKHEKQEGKEKHLMLTAQLEQEIRKQKTLNYSLSKEREELRAERASFEREWELLDDKRNKLNDDREKLEKEFQIKEENLNMRFQGVSRKFEEFLKNLSPGERFEEAQTSEKSQQRRQTQGRQKRKKTVGPMGQTPGEKGYNLRNSAMVKARVEDHLTNQERGDA